MGNRYVITGVQVGMIRVYGKTGKIDDLIKLMNKIEKEQCIGNDNELRKQFMLD